MKQQKIIPDPVLMVISILAITVFQIYWLQQNYTREEKTLAIKTEVVFRETIMQLQVAKLKLDGVEWNGKDKSNGRMNIFMQDDEAGPANIRFKPKEEIISTINVIRDKLKDSLRIKSDRKTGLIITMNKTSENPGKDSIRVERTYRGSSPNGNQVFNVLYGVDSLQDSLRVTEIDTAFIKALQKEKLDIPFSILKLDSTDTFTEPAFNEVTVGFSHPVTYKLKLGNTFPYLIGRITQPILFSILLLGITILAFSLLYKNLLRQKRLAAIKNEFISNITHELKTPLATVGVAIEALKNFNAIQDPQRTKEYLDISSNELQRLGLLVDKVLKLSMFEKKEVELKFETVNLKEVVDEVVSSLKLQLEKYRAIVSITHTGDLTIQGDRLHLLSVVFNLIDNALKYSTAEPAIHIDIMEKNNNVVLTITDNGIGIGPEYQGKIFEKFFRIPHGDTHNAKGYGLGLSYSAQVIQKHNGAIEVESKPVTGTTFSIILPKATA